jgi:hypothetical protein
VTDLLAAGPLEAAGAAAVDELERGDVRHRRDDGGPPFGELPRRGRLHPADGDPAQASSPGRVLHTRDLRLVGHEADQSEARPRHALPGQGSGVHGGVHG